MKSREHKTDTTQYSYPCEVGLSGYSGGTTALIM